MKELNQSTNEHSVLRWLEHGGHFMLVCDKEIKFSLEAMENHLEEIRRTAQGCWVQRMGKIWPRILDDNALKAPSMGRIRPGPTGSIR